MLQQNLLHFDRPFWDACKAHRLLLPYCRACGKPHLPPGPVCPFCFGDAFEWRAASGRGTISTWVVVHQPWFAAFKDDLPYNVVQVELEEGPRMTSSVVGLAHDELRVGLPVRVTFDDVTGDITLPRFRPDR
jgi:uncharacterized OB-fold protein